jgi:hypothetical protein
MRAEEMARLRTRTPSLWTRATWWIAGRVTERDLRIWYRIADALGFPRY